MYRSTLEGIREERELEELEERGRVVTMQPTTTTAGRGPVIRDGGVGGYCGEGTTTTGVAQMDLEDDGALVWRSGEEDEEEEDGEVLVFDLSDSVEEGEYITSEPSDDDELPPLEDPLQKCPAEVSTISTISSCDKDAAGPSSSYDDDDDDADYDVEEVEEELHVTEMGRVEGRVRVAVEVCDDEECRWWEHDRRRLQLSFPDFSQQERRDILTSYRPILGPAKSMAEAHYIATIHALALLHMKEGDSVDGNNKRRRRRKRKTGWKERLLGRRFRNALYKAEKGKDPEGQDESPSNINKGDGDSDNDVSSSGGEGGAVPGAGAGENKAYVAASTSPSGLSRAADAFGTFCFRVFCCWEAKQPAPPLPPNNQEATRPSSAQATA